MSNETKNKLKKAVFIVAAANFLYFFIEFSMALKIDSVSLFADSVDFLEDAAVNFLLLFAIGWSAKKRAQVGMIMAGLLLWPVLATIWSIGHKFFHLSIVPHATGMYLTGFGALIINVFCAFLLSSLRDSHGSLSKAAFFSARNDAIANIAIIFTGFITIYTHSAWPDLLVGIGIGIINLGAAKEVYQAAKKERKELALDKLEC